MNIAVIGSISKPTHTSSTGGIEVWTALFIKESLRHGHTFDLYSLPGSLIGPGINLIEVFSKSLDQIKFSESFQKNHSRAYNQASLFGIYFSRILLELKAREQKYDLVINSSGSPLIPIHWDQFTKPLITIGHFAASEPFVSFFEYFPLPKNAFFVFPTQRELNLAHAIPESQKFFIPHGIDLSAITFEKTKRDRLLWFGRLDPSMPKGLPEAITLSNTLKIPIDIFTYIEDNSYFEKSIKPLFTELTHFQTGVARQEYFKRARVYIVPLGWEEPFGLTILEALASGTPVVAYAKGAMPEILKDGETGFLVNPADDDIRGSWHIKKTGLAGLQEAVEKIYALSDQDYKKLQMQCRNYIEKRYSVAKMVERYEALYKKILGHKSSIFPSKKG